jgi:hypothetical protein
MLHIRQNGYSHPQCNLEQRKLKEIGLMQADKITITNNKFHVSISRLALAFVVGVRVSVGCGGSSIFGYQSITENE